MGPWSGILLYASISIGSPESLQRKWILLIKRTRDYLASYLSSLFVSSKLGWTRCEDCVLLLVKKIKVSE